MRKFLRLSLLAVTLCSVIYSEAQSRSQSPYSLAGIGELKYRGFMQHKAMGGVSRAIRDQYSFTTVNPASYANVKYTVYSAGMYGSYGQLMDSIESVNVTDGNIGYFAMAFGIPRESGRKMGVSFGFQELSSVGYDMRNYHLLDTPAYYDIFRGSGGLSTVYVGYGIETFKNLYLGANVNFNFGSISTLKAKVYPYTKDLFSYSDEVLSFYTGVNFDFGVQYSIQDSVGKQELRHSFGATFHTRTRLKGDGYKYAETFFGIPYDQSGTLVSIDTLSYVSGLTDTLIKPIGFGFAYSIGKDNVWGISAEFEMNKWSDINSRLNGQPFFDNVKYAVGFHWTPNLDFTVKEDYWQKVEYRAGFRHQRLYYNFFGQELTEYGITFGLGLPIIRGYTLTEERVDLLNHVDLSVEYVNRGTTSNGLIQEQYLVFSIGLNFNDKWFIKRKYL